jgi:hypothetical protein
MPVIPEKRQLDARVRGALGAQFWAQPVESGRAVVGATAATPCEPPPLPLAAPSGLSRTQLLVAAQAAGLPFFPGWCEAHGGTVRGRAAGAWGAGGLAAAKCQGRGCTVRSDGRMPTQHGQQPRTAAPPLPLGSWARVAHNLPHAGCAGWCIQFRIHADWRRKGLHFLDRIDDAAAPASAAAAAQVLDRVLVQTGRKRWWGALTGRLKAQRMVGQRGTHTLVRARAGAWTAQLARTTAWSLEHLIIYLIRAAAACPLSARPGPRRGCVQRVHTHSPLSPHNPPIHTHPLRVLSCAPTSPNTPCSHLGSRFHQAPLRLISPSESNNAPAPRYPNPDSLFP